MIVIEMAGAPELEAEPKYWRYIQDAAGRSPYCDDSAHKILEHIWEGKAELFTVSRDGRPVGAFVTESIRRKVGRALHVWALGGEGVDDWLEALLEYLEELKRLSGANVVTMAGRRGWVRKLIPYGWRTDYVHMIKG